MIVGVPREIKPQEYRIGLLPSAAYARTATQALTNVTCRHIELLADYGLEEACQMQGALLGGINVKAGQVLCPGVAEAHGLELGRFQPGNGKQALEG